jgi:hypothetical protein
MVVEGDCTFYFDKVADSKGVYELHDVIVQLNWKR